jgi:L-fucose isomerase-like protein
MSQSFLYTVLASPLHDAAALHHALLPYTQALDDMGGKPILPEDLAGEAPALIVVGTGGTEHAVLHLVERSGAGGRPQPVLLVAHPGHNSLPAALEALARLQLDGRRGRILFLDGPGDGAGWAGVADNLAGRRAARDLRESRIGLLGAPSDWLVASQPDPAAVRRRWGPTVVKLPVDWLYDRLAELPPEAGAERAGETLAGAAGLEEPDGAAVAAAARVWAALAGLVEEERLDAVAVRCFDLVRDQAVTGCLALAWLADDGTAAGCEGDLCSTLGLLLADRLLGRRAWMANPYRIVPAAGELGLAHCTVPIGLVDGYRLRSHFESGLGVGVQGEFRPGPVTLLRIGGRDLESLWLAEGEITAAGAAESLCRTQVRLRIDPADAAELLAAPLGNHLVLVPGRHREPLRAWWELYIR